jgi:hypothetical protein
MARCAQRCRLDRIILLAHNNIASTLLWQGLYVFRRQMDLFIGSGHLRSRISHLCRSHQLDDAYRGKSGCWCRSRSTLLWRHDHHRLHRSSTETCNLHCSTVQHVRNRQYSRTPAGWSLHRSWYAKFLNPKYYCMLTVSQLHGDGYDMTTNILVILLICMQCFWINLPFGAIGLVAVFFFFENPERRHTDMTFKEKIKQIDLLGAFILICAIVCLLLALQWGGTIHPWSDSKVWGCLLGFGLLIIIFIALQIKLGDRATLPPRILVKNRTVLVSALYSSFFAMGLYT